MLYRVHLTVLKVQASGWLANPNPYANADWHEAVAHTFGVNAPSAAEATRLAAQAAENLVDRNGEYMGGLVVEVACRCVDPQEFTEYKKCLHNPINEPGIFYVSGSNVYFLPGSILTSAIAELDSVRSRIKQSGLPPVSFVKPPLPDVPVEKMRLQCSVCKRWIETDSEELMHLFMKGMHSFTIEDKKVWRSINVVGPFMQRHIAQCMLISGGPRGMLRAIHKPDPQWEALDPGKEERSEESEDE